MAILIIPLWKLKNIFDDDALTAWAADHKNPEDIFSDKKLSEWAEENGYIKE